MRGRHAEPDPAQTAARLVPQRRGADDGWFRGHVRRVERASLLFLASIAPGVAERHIANLEAEARRVAREQREAEEAAANAASAAAAAASAAASNEEGGGQQENEGQAQDGEDRPAAAGQDREAHHGQHEEPGAAPGLPEQPLIDI